MVRFDFRDASGPDIRHWSGYLEFLLQRGARFQLISVDKLRSMTPSERLAYDSSRLEYLADRVVVENETVLSISQTLAAVMHLNHGKPKGGYGVFASAPSGRGKTTALHFVLQDVFADYLERDPGCIAENRCCPVAYICIPDSGTPKSIYMEIADYLGVEYKPRDSDPVMRKLVLAGIANSGIQVFVIDEVQNLENGGPYAKRAADAVRRLADDTQATYILAGINLEGTTLIEGTRGLQIANRFIRASVADYGNRSRDWMARWTGLAGAMADALPLYGTSPEVLQRLAGQLHDLTRGSVQALNLVLTQTARELIELQDDSQEIITLERLQSARLNLATEQHVKAQLEKTAAKQNTAVGATRARRAPPRSAKAGADAL